MIKHVLKVLFFHELFVLLFTLIGSKTANSQKNKGWCDSYVRLEHRVFDRSKSSKFEFFGILKTMEGQKKVLTKAFLNLSAVRQTSYYEGHIGRI